MGEETSEESESKVVEATAVTPVHDRKSIPDEF
jgi:hypothetical protein